MEIIHSIESDGYVNIVVVFSSWGPKNTQCHNKSNSLVQYSNFLSTKSKSIHITHGQKMVSCRGWLPIVSPGSNDTTSTITNKFSHLIQRQPYALSIQMTILCRNNNNKIRLSSMLQNSRCARKGVSIEDWSRKRNSHMNRKR